MKYRSVCLFLSVWTSLLASSFGQSPWSGIISPTRATDWTTAGIPIPSGSWTQYGSTIAPYGSSGSPASPSTINTALHNCSVAGHEYVLLGAGDFYLSGGVDFNSTGTPASNCELRGMGANQTRLHFSNTGSCNGWEANVCLEGSNTYNGGGYTQANWTSGYSQGATTITLSSVSGIVTNLTPIVLDACDTGFTGTAGSETCTGTATDNNNLFVCESGSGTGHCITESDAGTTRTNRGQEEVVIATAISGTGPYTVTISPGLRNPNWSVMSTPQAWWGSQTITDAGVKDLLIDTSGDPDTSSLVMDVGYKLWAQGIASDTSNNYHIKAYITSHAVIRDSYAYWTANAAQQSYGLGGGTNGDLLVENNIIQGVVAPLSEDASCSGCVFGYNFAVNQYNNTTAYEFGMGSFHAAGESETLMEGNIGDTADMDDIHGSHFLDTFFRNYFNGYESNNGTMPTDDTSPIHFAAYSRYMIAVGNVLGTAGYHTAYACIPATTTTANCANAWKDIWDLGWSGNTYGGIDVQTPPAPNDILVAPTTMRWGNYDVVRNAVSWCGNSSDTGWSTTCGSTSEIPTGDSYYPNSVPTVGDTGAGMSRLPSSFYNGVTGQYSNCGTGLSYWRNPTSGTCPQYPPVGPDVTSGDIGMCTSGTYKWSRALTSAQCGGGTFNASVNGGYGNSNPAMRCYLNQMNGTPDGTGSMLTFNRTSCYASDPAAQATLPPPVGVTGTVVAN